MRELIDAMREVGPEAVRHTVVQAWMVLAWCASAALVLVVACVVCVKVTAGMHVDDRRSGRVSVAAIVAILALVLAVVAFVHVGNLLEPVGATIKAVLKGAKQG